MVRLPQRGNVPQRGVFHTPRLCNTGADFEHHLDQVPRSNVLDYPPGLGNLNQAGNNSSFLGAKLAGV